MKKFNIKLNAKQKAIAKYVGIALQVAIIVITITFSVFTIMSTGKKQETLSFAGNTALLPVRTDSMEPTIAVGDLIIAKNVKDISTLKKGDIITFSAVINGRKGINTHRIEDIKTVGESTVFVTKGDNAPAGVTENVYAKDVLAVYKNKIGGFGKAIFWLQTPLNFFLVIMIPLILLFIANGYYFVKMIISLKLKKALADKEKKEDEAALAEEEIKKKAIEDYIANQKN